MATGLTTVSINADGVQRAVKFQATVRKLEILLSGNTCMKLKLTQVKNQVERVIVVIGQDNDWLDSFLSDSQYRQRIKTS